MKACVVQELSGPSGLVYTDIEDIADVVAGHVVIDVKAAGVVFPDLLLSRGEYQLKMAPPFVPGMEAAGVVRSAPEESGFSPGDHVSAFGVLGSYAEQVAAPVANVRRSAAGLDHAEAVSLLVNYNTMYFALAKRAAMRPGETVLVLGSAGGVGTAAIQVAKAMGGRVIAMVHREGALDYVGTLGADVVLPLADGWLQAVKDHTDGRGVDIVVDPIGGPAFDDAVRVLAGEGRLLVIGFAAGAIPSVKVNRLLLRNVGVLGVAWGEYLSRNPQAGSLFASGVDGLVAGGLKPPPPQRYPLSEGRAALQSLADGGVLGKVVLEP